MTLFEFLFMPAAGVQFHVVLASFYVMCKIHHKNSAKSNRVKSWKTWYLGTLKFCTNIFEMQFCLMVSCFCALCPLSHSFPVNFLRFQAKLTNFKHKL